MKKLKGIIIILIISFLLTGCTSKENKELGMKLAGKYIMTELQTNLGKTMSKEDLKEAGFEGYIELREDLTGAYVQGETKKELTFDEDYLYYPSDRTLDTYEYKDGNIVLISEVGGRLTFVKE